MQYRKNSFLFFIFIFYSFSLASFARVHDFETSRLKSTAGTGVASILFDEGSLLNPAPLAFYSISSVYLQKNKTKFSSPRSNAPNPSYIPGETDSHGMIFSDGRGTLKGSLSYQKQKEWDSKRRRISMAMASAIGGASAMGFTFRHSKDLNRHFGELKEDNYYQVCAGIIHAIDENFSVGLVVNDLLRKKKEDTRFIFGAQYLIRKIIEVMADVGSDYNDDLSDNLLYRGAVQLNSFNDFYLRWGYFYDRKIKEKGNGLGIGWVTPRFNIEFGMKMTKSFSDGPEIVEQNYPPSKMRDLSLSVGIRL